MPQRRFHVVFNPKSGTSAALGLTSTTLAEKFAAHGVDATIDDDDDVPLETRIEWAIDGGADVIVAGGGDGTVLAVAEAVIEADRILAILPLGTMNAMARDVGLPLDLDQAISAMADGLPHRVDVGEVNGRLFLENVSIGFVTSLAVMREKIRGKGLLARFRFVRECFARVAEGRRIAMEVTPAEGSPRIERARAITVANGPYLEAPGRIMAREWINDGLLSLYTFHRLGVGDVLRLIFGMIIGRWKQDEAVAIEVARAVTIRMKRPFVRVILDGEVVALETPLSFSVRPLALQILLPAPPAEPTVDAPVAAEA